MFKKTWLLVEIMVKLNFLLYLWKMINLFLCACSSMMAIVTCLVGLHYGHIIVHFKVIHIHGTACLPFVIEVFSFFSPIFIHSHIQDHKDRIFHWMITTSCLILLGLSLDLCGK